MLLTTSVYSLTYIYEHMKTKLFHLMIDGDQHSWSTVTNILLSETAPHFERKKKESVYR